MARSEDWQRIRLSHWSVQAAIGAYDHEKTGTQELILELSLWGDFARAARTDALEDALDYAALKAQVEAWLVGKRWQLLEALGEALADELLKNPLVQRLELSLEKPAALAPALVCYTLYRQK